MARLWGGSASAFLEARLPTCDMLGFPASYGNVEIRQLFAHFEPSEDAECKALWHWGGPGLSVPHPTSALPLPLPSSPLPLALFLASLYVLYCHVLHVLSRYLL